MIPPYVIEPDRARLIDGFRESINAYKCPIDERLIEAYSHSYLADMRTVAATRVNEDMTLREVREILSARAVMAHMAQYAEEIQNDYAKNSLFCQDCGDVITDEERFYFDPAMSTWHHLDQCPSIQGAALAPDGEELKEPTLESRMGAYYYRGEATQCLSELRYCSTCNGPCRGDAPLIVENDPNLRLVISGRTIYRCTCDTYFDSFGALVNHLGYALNTTSTRATPIPQIDLATKPLAQELEQAAQRTEAYDPNRKAYGVCPNPECSQPSSRAIFMAFQQCPHCLAQVDPYDLTYTETNEEPREGKSYPCQHKDCTFRAYTQAALLNHVDLAHEGVAFGSILINYGDPSAVCQA